VGVVALVALVLLVRRSARDRRRLTEPDAVRERSFRKSRGHGELDHAAVRLAALMPPLPDRRAEAVDMLPGEPPAAAPAPVADEPAVSSVADPLREIRAELARARAEHLAASLLLFDGA